METNFQTSFIPKKPMVPERTVRSRPLGLLTILSLLVFFTVLIATGALYFYKETLAKSIANMENDLRKAETRFEPEAISKFELLNRRLNAGKTALDRHVAISPIFKALEEVTMKSVRYNKFSYSLEGNANTKMIVKLDGIASDYRSIALQSDLYSQSKYFKNPIFSNLSLDNKGSVNFDLEFTVDPVFVDYKKLVEGTNVSQSNSGSALE